MLVQLTNDTYHVGLYQTDRTDVENFQSDFDESIQIANDNDNGEDSLVEHVDELLALKGFVRVFAEEVYTEIL